MKRNNGRGGACSSRIIVQEYNRMDMIGHDNVIFNRNTRKTGFNLTVISIGFVNTGGASPFGLHLFLEIFLSVIQNAGNISKRRKVNFNLPLTVQAVAPPLFI